VNRNERGGCVLHQRYGVCARAFGLAEDPVGTLLLFAHLNEAKAPRLVRVAEKIRDSSAVARAELASARAELLRLRPSSAILEAFERATGMRPGEPSDDDAL